MNEESPRLKLLLFGGSFDPIHLGHLQILRETKELLGLDRAIVIPCKQSPHKKKACLSTAQQRLEMLKLTLQDDPWAEVSDFEISSPSPSYSWVTATHYRQKFPNHDLYWLIGTDQWETLDQWKNITTLDRLLQFVVYTRKSLPSSHPARTPIILQGEHPASSSAIRAHLAKHEEWLHPECLSFIKKENLYY